MSQEHSQSPSSRTPMSAEAVARIRRATTMSNGGRSPNDGFVNRAQKAVARRDGKGGGKK